MYSRLLELNVKHKETSQTSQVGSRVIVGLLFLCLTSFLSSCSLTPAKPFSQTFNGPTKTIIADVPFFAQDKYQCGPAALAMVLSWSGVRVQPSDLTPEVYSPELKGSLQNDLISAARRHGRVAYPITGPEVLFAEVSAGHPVIVLVNLSFFWYPKWHYAVVIGYDQERKEVVLHSGRNSSEVISFRTFMNIWERSDLWGLLVLSPDRIPASAGELEWLAAVSGLENTEDWQAASTGYSSALKKWKNSVIAWMGLGNSRYKLKDLEGSAEAFYQATLIQPQNGMAFNNLATVLSEQGEKREALVAAQKAVDLGGPFIATFRQTLKEIHSRQ